MAISKVVQHGAFIYIYDQNGKTVTFISAPSHLLSDGLKTYTAESISVQKGSLLYSYDKQGKRTSVTPMVVH